MEEIADKRETINNTRTDMGDVDILFLNIIDFQLQIVITSISLK